MASSRPPTHPGAILREDVIPAINKSVTEVARELGVSRQILHRILAEQGPITPEMALRIGKFCGNGPNVWLSMQIAYDLWHAQVNLKDELAKVRPAVLRDR